MDEPVDCSSGRHRILEDPVPLAEHEVAGDDHRAPLIALGEKREQDLHLVAVLLDVADVIEQHGVEAVEDRELVFETQVALGDEQALYEREGRGEQHPVAAQDQLVCDGADEVGLAAAGMSEREEIVTALDERALAQRRDLLRDLARQTCSIQRSEGLVRWESRVLEVALDAAAPPLEELELDEMVEVALEGPAFAIRLLCELLGVPPHGRELEGSQHDRERGPGRFGHAAAWVSSSS